MAETSARDIIISFLFFALLVSAVVFIVSSIMVDNNVTPDKELSENFKAFNTSATNLADDFQTAAANQTGFKKFVSVTQDFIGSAIGAVVSFVSAPVTFLLMLNFLRTSWGFDVIPSFVWVSLIGMGSTFIFFIYISLKYRYRA